MCIYAYILMHIEHDVYISTEIHDVDIFEKYIRAHFTAAVNINITLLNPDNETAWTEEFTVEILPIEGPS